MEAKIKSVIAVLSLALIISANAMASGSKTKSAALAEFSYVEVKNDKISAFLVVGESNNIKLKGNEEAKNAIKTEIVGETLIIDVKEGSQLNDRCKVIITYKSLKGYKGIKGIRNEKGGQMQYF